MTVRALTTLAVVSFLMVGCATVPMTGRTQLALVPEADMVTAATQNYDEFLGTVTVSTDPAENALVSRIGERVAASAEHFLTDVGMAGDLKYYDWRFSVVDDDETVNAFCMPGGKIVVYTGIIPVAQDENQLAVVIGHEVAHAIAHHASERMSQILITELGGMALSRAIQERPSETQGWMMLAYGLGAQLGVILPYSRTHEKEADRIGLILMAQAGYDPRAAVPFWTRMDALGGPRPPEFLSTHPEPSTRIGEIQKYMPEALRYYEASQH
jgi:predicted Zn-dependent protease